MEHSIRLAEPRDADDIWAILSPVFAGAETYAVPHDITREAALAYWLAPEKTCFVAGLEGRIAGTYYLRANQPGPGAHVANCGYISAPWGQGRGLARAMCAHSLEVARAAGFRAMQFNLVVSTNTRGILPARAAFHDFIEDVHTDVHKVVIKDGADGDHHRC